MSAFYWLPEYQNGRDPSKYAAWGLIRFAKQGISRAAATVIINDLPLNGIILNTERRFTARGRPLAVIDIGAMHLSAEMGDFSTRILESV